MMAIPYFFAAAAGGFVLLAAVGMQALVALFSSISLTRRHKAENPAFDTSRAYRRIVLVTVIVTLLMVLITALVIRFTPISATFGYLVGMIVAFLCSLKRMSPSNETNQKNYEEAYADCYPAPRDQLDDTKPIPTLRSIPATPTSDPLHLKTDKQAKPPAAEEQPDGIQSKI